MNKIALVNLKKHKTTISGPEAIYTDRNGNECAVFGTFALGSLLSWHNATGDYMIICGHDQGRSALTGKAI